MANEVRRLARENTPIQYAQKKIMNELHKNSQVALNYQKEMTSGFSGLMYQLNGGDYFTDSVAFFNWYGIR